MNLKEAKAVIRAYMREHYRDSDLVRALDHARAGKLAYYSCCCFAGIPTRGLDRALHGEEISQQHYMDGDRCVGEVRGGLLASSAYCAFGRDDADDPLRRRRLIPMLLAEIRRRRVAATATAKEASNAVVAR